jgi:hypothetical protein
VQVKASPEKTPPEKTPSEKTPQERALSLDIAAGEWDDFQYSLNNVLKKTHK